MLGDEHGRGRLPDARSTARSSSSASPRPTGYLDITITNNSFLIAAGLKVTIGPLVFDISGSLGIYSNGLTATLDVSLELNLLSLIELKMSGSLKLDTRTS